MYKRNFKKLGKVNNNNKKFTLQNSSYVQTLAILAVVQMKANTG